MLGGNEDLGGREKNPKGTRSQRRDKRKRKREEGREDRREQKRPRQKQKDTLAGAEKRAL